MMQVIVFEMNVVFGVYVIMTQQPSYFGIFGIKFIYSEKAKKFCEISTVDLTITTQDKSTVEVLQNFVAFSKYMNFTRHLNE